MNSIFKIEDFTATKQPETLKFFNEQVPENIEEIAICLSLMQD